MKFGGTSVADLERLRAVAARLVTARDAGHRVVGVLSAMGDTTDELLELAHRMSATPKPRAVDMLISVGERISCALAEMAIEDLGRHAVSLTGSQAGIVTDTVHGQATIVDVRAWRVQEALDAGRIVLVAGFQGVSTEREVTTLGRGGSNLTAVALAAALGAESCEMRTDVDGVYTADAGCTGSRGTPCARSPRRVPRCCRRARSHTPRSAAWPSTCGRHSATQRGRGSSTGATRGSTPATSSGSRTAPGATVAAT